MKSATFVKNLIVDLYIMISFCHLTKYEHTHVALVLCPFVSCPFVLKPFANLHYFLICTLILSLSPAGWLCNKMLPRMKEVHGTEQNQKAAHSHTMSVTLHSLFTSKHLIYLDLSLFFTLCKNTTMTH